jgi:hypothetical protein
VYTIYRLKNMGWGKRFYETTYGDGQRTRRCWGCGPGATEAAMRVQDEKNARAEDIALVRSYQLRDKQIDRKVKEFAAFTNRALNRQLAPPTATT